MEEKEQEKEPMTVMYVDYTKGGELASSMRELAKRLSSVTHRLLCKGGREDRN